MKIKTVILTFKITLQTWYYSDYTGLYECR